MRVLPCSFPVAIVGCFSPCPLKVIVAVVDAYTFQLFANPSHRWGNAKTCQTIKQNKTIGIVVETFYQVQIQLQVSEAAKLRMEKRQARPAVQ